MELVNSTWSLVTLFFAGVPAIYDEDSTWSPAGIHSSSMWANVELHVEFHILHMDFMSPDFIYIDNEASDKEDHDDKDADVDEDDHDHNHDDDSVDVDMDDCNNKDTGKSKANSKANGNNQCEGGEAKAKANSDSKCKGGESKAEGE
ncbi:hypothetical protein CVT25_003953 [Psilocybe cyanescens]|uniref:Uncharacterized protein n=1 Tax=Psilocybe cyanescens TaxID=93625 RepID=A0A409XE07_PSICY|nr:hypothetical protein CVT25_003953 [Psilocybe cyanescens]